MNMTRRALCILAMTFTLASAVLLSGCAQDSSSSSSSSSEPAAAGISVSVAVDGSAANGPVDVYIVAVSEGATVLDALEATSLTVTTEDSAYGPFVTSIEGIENGSLGSQSGWTYTVNEEYASASAGELALADGDAVAWTFVE